MTTKEIVNTDILRRLGVSVAVLLAMIGWVLLWTDLVGGSIFAIAALVILVAALIKPSLLKRGDKAVSFFAEILRYVIPQFILVILFYLILTPIGLVLRLFGGGHSSLNRPQKERESYWTARKPAPHDREQMEKQY